MLALKYLEGKTRWKTAAPILMLLVLRTAWAGTLYVSQTGNDSNDGSEQKPFRTIQHAADLLQPGDTCEVSNGTYRETIKPAHTGENGKPITIRAKQGDAVIVSGADLLTNWSIDKDGIRAPVDGPVTQFFLDGVMLQNARWPESDGDPMNPTWLTAGPGSTATTIVDPTLPFSNRDDLVGATLHILSGRKWISWTRSITDYDPATHTITFKDPWSADEAYALKEGASYYIFGNKALQTSHQWFCDGKNLFVGLKGFIRRYDKFHEPPTEEEIAKLRFEVKRRNLAFDLSKLENIHVEGFRIFAATISLADSAHCEVSNCHIRYASHFTEASGWGTGESGSSGVLLGGHDNILRDSSVVFSSGNGVTMQGERNNVTNCLIRNVNYAIMDSGCIWADGRDHVISHNTLSDAGRTVLVHRGLKHGRIEYNDMYNAGLLTTDLGVTYCYETDGEGTVIAHNWVHDNKAKHVGVGIYIDNGSSNFVIHHNVSWNNTDSGIRLNTPSPHNVVVNNTILNNGDSINFWPEKDRTMTSTVIANNLFNNRFFTGDDCVTEHNQYSHEPQIVSFEHRDFALIEKSICIDTGGTYEGIKDGFTGKSPDIGAYESGQPAWKPGHNWGDPPQF